MADFGLPVLTSTYSDMVDTLKARDIDGLIWLDGATSVGLPTGAKRWNSTNNYFEKFSGSTWSPLAAKYMINVDYVDGCSVNDLGDTITDLWTASKIGSMLNNKLNVLDYNATDILTKLKTVDGTGSGLDADLLDGMGATNTNTFNTIVARDASGNFSAGAITVASVNGITGLSSISPLVAGVGTAGTSNIVSRQDHVHPLQVNISGNAATATWAASCESANKLIGKNWYWSGQDGQPNWLWGGTDGANMYVYNPANFIVAGVSTPSSGYKHLGAWGNDSITATGNILVNSAYRAMRAHDLSNHQWDAKAQSGYIRLSTGLIMQWGRSGDIGAGGWGTVTFPMTFPSTCVNVQLTKDTSNTTTADYAMNATINGNGSFNIWNGATGTFACFWIAIGW